MKALKKDIGILSKQNLKLKKELETSSYRMGEKDVLPQPKVPQPTGQETPLKLNLNTDMTTYVKK